MSSDMVISAKLVASIAHRGQVDKAGRDYIDHPRAVAATLEEHGELAVVAGWLHDVVEDSDFTIERLSELGFPEEVLTAVDSVTRRAGESYFDMVRRAAADPIGRLVKLADNRHNSDEARLVLLPAEAAERLRKRYAKAREILLAAGHAPICLQIVDTTGAQT